MVGEDANEARPDESTSASQDLLYVHGKNDSGHYSVVRSRNDGIEFGELRGLRQGEDIHGELVRLSPSEKHDQLFEVDVLMEAPRQRSTAGPPKVATGAYRAGWDKIFGDSKSDSTQLN